MKIIITKLVRNVTLNAEIGGYIGDNCELEDYEAIIHKISKTLQKMGVVGNIELVKED